MNVTLPIAILLLSLLHSKHLSHSTKITVLEPPSHFREARKGIIISQFHGKRVPSRGPPAFFSTSRTHNMFIKYAQGTAPDTH